VAPGEIGEIRCGELAMHDQARVAFAIGRSPGAGIASLFAQRSIVCYAKTYPRRAAAVKRARSHAQTPDHVGPAR
jgi:hypothetical protein